MGRSRLLGDINMKLNPAERKFEAKVAEFVCYLGLILSAFGILGIVCLLNAIFHLSPPGAHVLEHSCIERF